MSTIPNNVRDLLKATNDRFAKARAEQGYGGLGPWPGETEGAKGSAEYVCDVTLTTTFENVQFKYGREGQGSGEHSRPAYRVQPSYVATARYKNGVAEPLPEPFEFKGQPLTIPFDFSNLPGKGSAEGNAAWRASNAEETLKGHLKGLLGYDPSDVADALADAGARELAATAANSRVQCRVFLEFREYTVTNGPKKGEKGINKQDYIRERLSN